MQNLAPIGIILAALIITHEVRAFGDLSILWNPMGLAEVLGLVVCAALVNYPFSQLRRSALWLIRVLRKHPYPSEKDVAAELIRLAKIARTQGGLLAIQNEGRTFANGFLNRAILVAIASGEREKTREILEADIQQQKSVLVEEANVFRTVGTLAPMFGLLGTLLGIILVLRNIEDPAKVGPAMSLAITASLYGISLANLCCLPIAGHIRTRSIDEARIKELILEGTLDLMSGESAYLMELKFAAYLPDRPEEPAEQTETAPS
jgi:chemotaxis protein MotA